MLSRGQSLRGQWMVVSSGELIGLRFVVWVEEPWPRLACKVVAAAVAAASVCPLYPRSAFVVIVAFVVVAAVVVVGLSVELSAVLVAVAGAAAAAFVAASSFEVTLCLARLLAEVRWLVKV